MGVDSLEHVSTPVTFLTESTSMTMFLNDFEMNLLRSQETFKSMDSMGMALSLAGGEQEKNTLALQQLNSSENALNGLQRMDWLEAETDSSTVCDESHAVENIPEGVVLCNDVDLDKQEFELFDLSAMGDILVQPVPSVTSSSSPPPSLKPKSTTKQVIKGKSTLQKLSNGKKRERKNYDPPKGKRVYFDVTEKDVCMGRGGETNQHKGNHRYHEAKRNLQPVYERTPKAGRTGVAQRLVDQVHAWGGRFLKKDKKGWYQVHNHTARTKCSQALRENYTPEERAAKREKHRNSKYCN